MGTISILPLAKRAPLVAKVADRLERFERAQAPGAADTWWRSLINDYRARARGWGVDAAEVDRQLRGLHTAVRFELTRRRREARRAREDGR